jgi:hypothetical protein
MHFTKALGWLIWAPDKGPLTAEASGWAVTLGKGRGHCSTSIIFRVWQLFLEGGFEKRRGEEKRGKKEGKKEGGRRRGKKKEGRKGGEKKRVRKEGREEGRGWRKERRRKEGMEER